MLMPCNALPLEKPAQYSVGGQKHHSQQRKRQAETKTNQMSEDSESSDEEEHYWAQASREPDVAPSVVPGVVQQPAPSAEEHRVETPLPMLLNNGTSGSSCGQ